jgi:sec-independent protein translocase protein TatB
MFGMGFTEILLIAVIAIVALGPEKLPTAMVDIAKFLKKVKMYINEAKSTIDNEIHLSAITQEAQKYKATLEDTKSAVTVEIKKLEDKVKDIEIDKEKVVKKEEEKDV